MTQSLFGHLALRFGSSPENLATEALSFILNHSHVAKQSFANLLGHINIQMPSNLIYETQNRSNDDISIPDLIGKDMTNIPIILGEAKFWAGLTDNQPVTYLNRLKQSNGVALIFFAPARRFSTIWPELHRRCNDVGIPLLIQKSEITEIIIARVFETQYLVLMSWRALLDTIHQALVTEGEVEMAGNVIQLMGLCERMDETAFLPLQSEELTSNLSQRLIQYSEIVDNVTEKLISEKFANKGGLRAAASRFGYLQYVMINHHATSIEFNANLWNKYRATPIWLGIQSNSWEFDPEAKQKLVSLETEEPSRLFRDGKILYIPLFLPKGVEKSDVIAEVIKQIKAVFELLGNDS